MAGLTYGVSGVCHQMANRILYQELALYVDAGVNGVVPNAGFFSTTIDTQAVEEDFGHRPALIEIIIPAGYRGAAYVHPWPEVQYPQLEVLIRAGSRFKVIDADPTHVVLEVIGDRGVER